MCGLNSSHFSTQLFLHKHTPFFFVIMYIRECSTKDIPMVLPIFVPWLLLLLLWFEEDTELFEFNVVKYSALQSVAIVYFVTVFHRRENRSHQPLKNISSLSEEKSRMQFCQLQIFSYHLCNITIKDIIQTNYCWCNFSTCKSPLYPVWRDDSTDMQIS